MVITTTNTDYVADNFPWKATKVTLNVVKVYNYEELEGKTALALSNEVRELMLKDLHQG